jgi:putative ABC transport system permease protein
MSEQAQHGGIPWREAFAQAWHTVRGHRMRSLLLILGVAIGVTTLLGIYTIVNGLSGRIRDDVVSSNRPYIYVSRYSGLGGTDPDEVLRRPQLLPSTSAALEEAEGVWLVDYEISNGMGEVLKYGQEKTNFVQSFGCSQNFPFLFSIPVDEGRFFSAEEVSARERVAVLGWGPRKDLFPYTDPVGKVIRIHGRPHRIVGTMAERKHIIGALGDNYVCVPWTAAWRIATSPSWSRTAGTRTRSSPTSPACCGASGVCGPARPTTSTWWPARPTARSSTRSPAAWPWCWWCCRPSA